MKYAVISGGTRGIGLATAKLFFEKGYCVRALYSSNEEDAARARALLPGVEFMKADVAKEGDVVAALQGLPHIDALICNAGVALFSQVQDTTWEDYTRVMDVNMGGVFLLCKHAAKRMLGRGGAIVTVSSVWGERGGSCESVYSASKGAVIAFTKALAKEFAPSGITVNCVSPGVIDTSMNDRLTQEEKKTLAEEIPMGRMGTVEEVAEAILFLAEHSYITGQTLGANGGFGL